MDIYTNFRAAMLAAALGMCGAAHAVDGVVLIDQDRALAGNVTPGDAPGFPVTISQPGSYRLSGNLTVPDANTTAIVITVFNEAVTIDLNGFSIIGPTSCTGFPPVCTPALASGVGITSAPNNNPSVHVRNGTVQGMGRFGIVLSSGRQVVEKILATDNGAAGIVISRGTVRESAAVGNKSTGISVGEGTVADSTADSNGLHGILVNLGKVSGNLASHNGAFGLKLGGISTGYADNVMFSNNAGNVSGGTPLGQNLCSGFPCP